MKALFRDFAIPDECNLSGAVLVAAGAGIFPDRSSNTYGRYYKANISLCAP